MLWTLVDKEIRTNLRNARFAVAYAACVLLMVGATASMLTGYLARKRVYDHERDAYEHSAASARVERSTTNCTVTRPPLLMQVFCQGTECEPDTRASADQWFITGFMGEAKQDVLALLFPHVDMLFVVGTLLSLLVFLLAGDAVSSERESGTLRLVLSCPLPRDMVMLGKWLGGFLCLAAPYLVAWLIVALLLLLTRSVTVSVDDWLRVAALAAIGLVYLATVFSLAVMVSVLVRRPDVSVLVLIIIWILAFVAVPALSTPLAWLANPGPSVQRTDTGILRANSTARVSLSGNALERQGALLAGRRLEELSREKQAEFHRIGSESIQQIVAFSRRETFRLVGEQLKYQGIVDDMARWMMRLSPAGCLQQAYVTVAGTDLQRDEALHRELERFCEQAFEATLLLREKGVVPAARFQVPRQRASDACAGALVDVGILATMGLLFFLVAFAFFLRSEAQ